MLDDLLSCVIKAQRSNMRTGEEKKSWVLECMTASGSNTDFAAISEWIDFIVMLLKDPAVHALFLRTQKSCLESLRRGC